MRALSNSTVIGGPGVEVDEDGFICNFGDWNQRVAVVFAEEEDIDEGNLTTEHWKVVNYLRDYYQKFGVAPMIRKLCKETGFPLKKIYDLFPSGPAKGACKIAGLPKPTGCV
ncbi:TusE/DsrC/DsvC family sulfur relay protein [Thermodesulfobacteriota bacterium]